MAVVEGHAEVSSLLLSRSADQIGHKCAPRSNAFTFCSIKRASEISATFTWTRVPKSTTQTRYGIAHRKMSFTIKLLVSSF